MNDQDEYRVEFGLEHGDEAWDELASGVEEVIARSRDVAARAAAPPVGFIVTDPEYDAPDGALMTFERVGGRWEPREDVIEERHGARAAAPPVEPERKRVSPDRLVEIVTTRYPDRLRASGWLPSPDPVAGLRGQQAKFALHRFAKTTDEADEINRIVDALLASDKPDREAGA